MPAAPTRDPRLPYREISDDFLPPRDPVLGYIKVGSRESKPHYTRAGKPWMVPTRLLDPARFEVVTREKRTQTVKGAKGSSVAGQDFTLDLGYVRDTDFHEIEGVGPKPSSLRIRLLYPKWNQNLIAFLGAYGGGEWVCRGNGVEATDTKRGECVCPCPRLIQFSGKYEGTKPNDGKKLLVCKPHAVLNVILQDASVFGGFWPFKTTSYESISNITKSLRMFEELFGRVDGLPLELRVMAVTKQLPGGGTTVQPIVTLVLPRSMDTARQVAAEAAAESRKYLPAGRELDEETYREAVLSEMEEEAESYAGEFLPEGEVETIEAIEDTTGPDEETTGSGGGTIEPKEETAEEERGDGPEGSGGRHPSPPDDPNQEDEDGVDDDPHGGRRDGEAGGGEQGGARPHTLDDGDAGNVPGGRRADVNRRTGDVGGGGQDRGEAPEAIDDSDRNDSEPEIDEYDRENYALATKVLEAADWTPDHIRGRLEYHEKTGTLDRLLERLEKNMPEAWAAATKVEEPEDGLLKF